MKDKYQLIVLESKLRITGILMKNKDKMFKIGKTGQNLEERFDKIYKQAYNHIFMIYTDPDKDLIDRLEKDLISEYKKLYPSLCNNNQIGGGNTSEDGELSHIYIVIQ